MKPTYLEIVRTLLSELESDDVNSLNQTVESEEVTGMVKQIYYHIIAGRKWPHLRQLFKLEEIPGVDNILQIPDDIQLIEWIKYNKRKGLTEKDQFRPIKRITPEKFTEICNSRDSTSPNVFVVDISDVKLLIRTDLHPQFWTSFNDKDILFDSFNSDVDTELDPDSTLCYGYRYPAVEVDDNFIFDLPVDAFPYFINECRSFVFNSIKQMPHVKAEQMAQTQRRRMSWENYTVPGYINYPNYGKRGRF